VNGSGLDLEIGAWSRPPRGRGALVTGTDTEVGKTVVAGALAAAVRRTGRRVCVFKPAASGCVARRGGLISEDADFLAAWADTPQSHEDVCPVRYAEALAPNVAAEASGRPVDEGAILDAYARWVGRCDAMIVEGVGGLLCPISDEMWVLHLARLLELPLVIVARPGLGTINHTLLTIHAARTAGLEVAGVVINHRCEAGPAGPLGEDGRGDWERAYQTNPHQIARLGRTRVLAILPAESENSVEDVTLGEATQATMAAVNWPGVLHLP
jgi:dethiobiotin synthetase